MDENLLKALTETFQGELDEQAQIITDGLLQLETDSGSEKFVDIIHSIFRAAHNIKGTAKAINITNVAEISHKLESLFSSIKNKNTQANSNTINLALSALDRIKDAMHAHKHGTELDFDIEKLCTDLINAANNSKPSTGTNPKKSTRKKTTAKKQPSEPKTETIEKITPPRPAEKEIIRLSTEKLGNIFSLVEDLQTEKINLNDQTQEFHLIHSKIKSLQASIKNNQLNTNGAVGVSTQAPFLNELQTALATISELTLDLYKRKKLSSSHIDLVSNSLQQNMHMLRLIPTATLLKPIARTVRDIAQELKKNVHFSIEGDEIELDRVILEKIRDPVIHLIRNAIDHGIEDSATRKLHNKPEQGKIHIKVSREGSEIFIRISDDGGGIDHISIGRLAVKKGLITEEELDTLTKDKLTRLIFEPGFSSREEVSNISGRGVGMDVVNTTLQQIKGHIGIDTEVGSGTTFELRLPLTIATERGLIIGTSDQQFAIPNTAIEHVLLIEPDDIVHLESKPTITLDGKTIPLFKLSESLDSKTHNLTNESFSVVVLTQGNRIAAFTVDEIVGEQEIIIKPLTPPLIKVKNIAGSTLNTRGDVILVLDSKQVITTALDDSTHTSTFDYKKHEAKQSQRILVVDDSITTRTLESSILKTQGYEVTIATNGNDGWKKVQQNPFDLIVTDIEMPLMNGFELTKNIKENKEYAHIPVVIVSSLSKTEEQERGLEVGADAYIVKDQFETKALLEVVKQLI